MTKREMLVKICELPGWQPPPPISSQAETCIAQLEQAGLIRGRGSGWEATPVALDAYPDFNDYPELRDPDAPSPIVAVEGPGDVPFERVVGFVRAVLGELPLDQVWGLASFAPSQLPPYSYGWDEARNIARELRKAGSALS